MSACEQQQQSDSVDSNKLKSLALDLAEQPENEQLLGLLLAKASKSTSQIGKSFVNQHNLLKTNGLSGSTFMNLAILGQEFLSRNFYCDAIELLDSSLKLAPENKKLRGSICSSLATAHFYASNYVESVKYMNEDLKCQIELLDVNGQCRVLRNLAHLHFKMGKLSESIVTHRKLIDLAMREKLFKQVCYTLSALGHVHCESNNLNAALTSHDRSLVLMRELGEPVFGQFKQLMAIGHIYSLLDDFKSAQEKYEEADELISISEQQQRDSSDKLAPIVCMSKEEIFSAKIMVQFNRALIALKTSSYLEARKFYEQILMLANGNANGCGNKQQQARSMRNLTNNQTILDDETRKRVEMRAYLGLAHTSRLEKNALEAKTWCEKHLNLAQDLTSKSQALTNLAMSYQHSKDLEKAHELFLENHKLVCNQTVNLQPSSASLNRNDSLLLALSHSYLASVNHSLAANNNAQFANIQSAREHYEKALEIFNTLEACEDQIKSVELNLNALTNLAKSMPNNTNDQSDQTNTDSTSQQISTNQQQQTTTTTPTSLDSSSAVNCTSQQENNNNNCIESSKANSTRTSTSVSNNTSASNSKSNSTNDINNHNHILST